jgi:hypothetical protein
MVDFEKLTHQFDGAGIKAIAFTGSYARGESGPFSDIDLLRLVEDPPCDQVTDSGTYLIDEKLVVVSNVTPVQVEEWFTRPETAVNVIIGIRNSRLLIDRDGAFAAIQAKANTFEWDAAMQQKATVWASKQMVGWIEEVHKGLEGLRRHDIGRMLNSRFGCSWGLSKLMQVQRGILISGDNAFYDEVAQAVGIESEWVKLRRIAFGIEDTNGTAPSLHEQVLAGLRLYVLTAELLQDNFEPKEALLVNRTVELIKKTLSNHIEAS